MSYYRNVYLKSEHWMNLRIERLALSNGLCAICGFRSVSNDVHHIRYGGSLYRVKADEDLRVLCRSCHTEIHRLLDENPDMKIMEESVRWREGARCIARHISERKKELRFGRSPWFRTFSFSVRLGNKPLIDLFLRMMREESCAFRRAGKLRSHSMSLWFLLMQESLGRLDCVSCNEVTFRISKETLGRTHLLSEHGPSTHSLEQPVNN